MPQIINTNVMSLNSQRNLNKSQRGLATALNRLSSGLRINSAKDDAAGLAISERFTSQIRGLSQAARNANDGISLAQTAEGALSEVGNMLQRMRELAVQSANATNSASDRTALKAEVTALSSEIDRISTVTDFNGTKLLDGTFAGKDIQVGSEQYQSISMDIASAKATSMGTYTFDADGTADNFNAATVNTVVAGDAFTIAGYAGTATTITPGAGAEIDTIVTSINAQTATTGVTASGRTETTLAVTATGSAAFDINGVTIAAGVADITDLSDLADTINAQSGTTGITASEDSGTITLVSDTGKDVLIENGAVGSLAITLGGTAIAAANNGTVGGQLSFESDKSFSITSGGAVAGLFATNAVDVSGLSAVGSIDISTATGAGDALSVIDGAIAKVSSIRSSMGALQSRFESTITNLQTSVENLSAARSRIQDADFAAETAELTRSQILQQAGTAMLAQANSIPQNVLSLLG